MDLLSLFAAIRAEPAWASAERSGGLAESGLLEFEELLDRETADQLRAFQADKPLSELIFDIRERQIANVVKRVGERTGLLEKYRSQGYSLSPHSFRHAYATHLYRNHMDSLGLEKLMGHTDLETTFANYVSCDLAYWQAGYDKSHELAGHRD